MTDIIECIKIINKDLGNYYKENIYQNALSLELNINGYISQTEVVIPISYKNYYLGFERADVVIYDSNREINTVLELKSQNTRISTKEINQLRKYLKSLNCSNGILVNFYETLEIYVVTLDSCHKV